MGMRRSNTIVAVLLARVHAFLVEVGTGTLKTVAVHEVELETILSSASISDD